MGQTWRSVVMASSHRLSSLFLCNPQPDEIALSPEGLHFDHRLQGFDGEGVPSSMRRNRDAPSIGVSVALMRSFLADEIESVAGESSDYFSA